MERIMGHRNPILLLTAAMLAVSLPLLAQDEAGTPVSFGGFDNHGSVTVAERFTDVRGYYPQFQEMFNLRNGFRLQDLRIYGAAKEGAKPFADRYSLSMSGLGGDLFPTAQFTVTKKRAFDFRANWRQSYSYWNRNDNVVLPIAPVGTRLSKGLTDNHDRSTVRKFGSASLTLQATDNL